MDGELGFFDIDLDKPKGVLGSLTVRQHSLEQHPGREMEFGRVEDDLSKLEMDFGNLGVDFGIVELGYLDKWW